MLDSGDRLTPRGHPPEKIFAIFLAEGLSFLRKMNFVCVSVVGKSRGIGGSRHSRISWEGNPAFFSFCSRGR